MSLSVWRNKFPTASIYSTSLISAEKVGGKSFFYTISSFTSSISIGRFFYFFSATEISFVTLFFTTFYADDDGSYTLG